MASRWGLLTRPRPRRRDHRPPVLPAVVVALLAAPTWAQSAFAPASTQPATAPASAPLLTGPEAELPADVRAQLAAVQDFTVGFDVPAFYAVVAFVRSSPRAPGFAQTPVEVRDWRDLIERPNSLRGCPVTVEGRVGRNKDPWTVAGRPELGLLSQLELDRPDQPVTVTVICTQDVSDVPVGATVRVTGYFVLVREYLGASGRTQRGAVLVAPGPSEIARAVARSAGDDVRRHLWWLGGSVVAALLIAWILLRRAAGGVRYGGWRDRARVRAAHAAPLNFADELARWAGGESRGGPPAAEPPDDRA